MLHAFIISKFGLEDKLSNEELIELDKKLQSFLAHAITRYKRDCCKFERFIKNSTNAVFLKNEFHLPEYFHENDKVLVEDDFAVAPPKCPKLGRKPLPFEEKSNRAKQYASSKVREQHESGAIILAASQQPSALGHLVKKTNSPSGQTARLALQAISAPNTPGNKRS